MLPFFPALELFLDLGIRLEEEFVSFERFFDAIDEELLKGRQGGVVEQDRVVGPMVNHVENEILDFQSINFGVSQGGQAVSSM
ncbi:hypothetical protein D3C75_723960 [compost metagenome]